MNSTFKNLTTTLLHSSHHLITVPTSPPWWKGSSFPYSQYKDLMPEDQFAKLLAMHENSAANAALYVAVVMAVYIVLLSLLLCRYVRRRPPIRELPLPILQRPETASDHTDQEDFKSRLFSCVTKPLDSLRLCSLRSGAGVASISSEDNDEEHSQSHTHSHHHRSHQDRRDSTIIRMSQLHPQPPPIVHLDPASGESRKGKLTTNILINVSMENDVIDDETAVNGGGNL